MTIARAARKKIDLATACDLLGFEPTRGNKERILTLARERGLREVRLGEAKNAKVYLFSAELEREFAQEFGLV